MKALDQQAQGNVLKKIIGLMGAQMGERKPQPKPEAQAEQVEQEASEESQDDEECPHCDGEGCRFCK